MNVPQQQQQQQQHHHQLRQHQDYRSSSQGSDRFSTTTPTLSTSSDNCSDSGEGIGGRMGSLNVGIDTIDRSRNPDQKRSRSTDADTAIDISQLFISPTLTTTTTPSPTIKTTATAVTAANISALD
ncbi:hypothetical protein BGZ96_003971, partial [Linnemannia gamsii]